MGLLATLTVLFIFFTIVAIVAIPLGVASLSFIAVRLLKSPGQQRLARYVVTIPSFVATFTFLYVAISLYGLLHSWPFPEDLARFVIALIVGQFLSAVGGFAWARRTSAP